MLNPVDLLIGPALRHPQRPRQGEAPGSRLPNSAFSTVTGALAAAVIVGYVVRAITRRIADR